jgi:hypothetical protein
MPIVAAAAASQDLNGAVCGVDKASHTVKVIPWDQAKKTWDRGGVRTIKLVPGTVVIGESKATVAELDAGKATIKSFHFAGMTSQGLAGTPFEIKDVSQILHRRVTVSFSGAADAPEVTKLALPYLFAGESMPAMVGNSGAQVVGSDDVTLGCSK